MGVPAKMRRVGQSRFYRAFSASGFLSGFLGLADSAQAKFWLALRAASARGQVPASTPKGSYLSFVICDLSYPRCDRNEQGLASIAAEIGQASRDTTRRPGRHVGRGYAGGAVLS
jgi:hypothetical protein